MPITATMRVLGSSPAAAQLIEAVERRTGIRLSVADEAPAEIELLVDPTSSAPEGYTLEIGDRAVVVGADAAGVF
jgi:hexosaminidase